MRIFQSILLIIGVPALGIMVCGLGMASFLAMTLLRPRPGQDPSLDWGGAIVYLFLGIVGSLVGAVGGLVIAVRHVQQRNDEAWSFATWMGICLGFVTALLVRFAGILDHSTPGSIIKWLPGLACFIAAFCALGGYIGFLASSRFGLNLTWNQLICRLQRPK